MKRRTKPENGEKTKVRHQKINKKALPNLKSGTKAAATVTAARDPQRSLSKQEQRGIPLADGPTPNKAEGMADEDIAGA